MYIIVNEIVAILKVLTFGDAVGGYKHINLLFEIGIKCVTLFRHRGEKSKHLVEVEFFTQLQCASSLDIARNECSVDAVLVEYYLRNIVVYILSSVGERSKDNDFAVVAIDWVSEFVANILQQLLQFTVVLRCDIGEHNEQQIEIVEVFSQVIAPPHIIHIKDVDFRLLTADKHSIFAVVEIETIKFFIISGHIIVVDASIKHHSAIEVVNRFDSIGDIRLNPLESKSERVYRTLQAFKQIDAHKSAQTALTSEA